MFRFQKFGHNQMEISELFPHLGSVIDDICLIRSMTTDAINHDPAHMFMNTGSQIVGRPSMGAWVTYGLGSEADDLPGFVVFVSTGKGRSPQPIAARQWSSGFLPSRYQGVQMHFGARQSMLYLDQPERRVARTATGRRGRNQRAEQAARPFRTHDPEIATRIAQYEMAFQMQTSVPELMDLGSESARTIDMYGCQPGDGTFATQLPVGSARLAERGVRFIQLYHRDWDHHSLLREQLPLRAREVDQACAALIKDLKQRGMFDDTLIVWTGEFGRTPMSQGNKGPVGRDHHNQAMSMWLAGAAGSNGIGVRSDRRAGLRRSRQGLPAVHDLHATMLHQLGIRHAAFSVKFQGLDARLTGVEGANVIHDILA